MTDFAKQRIALRYWLLGAGYVRAAAAMTYAEGYHTGQRKGGAPEFSHQVAIASQVRCLVAQLRFPEDTIITALLHDVREDYDVADAEIATLFGPAIATAVDALTKEFRGERRDEGAVFAAIAADPLASVVKLADRIHNHSTMVGVFSPDKIAEYIAETQGYFLPLVKAARRRFPDQEPAYELLSLTLNSQLDLLTALLGD